MLLFLHNGVVMNLSLSISNLYTSLAKSKFTRILIGIMEDNNKKYLKNNMKFSPVLPSKPLIRINIKESKTMTVNNILLKKLS